MKTDNKTSQTTEPAIAVEPVLAPVKFTKGDMKFYNILTGKVKCFDAKIYNMAVKWCQKYIDTANEYIQTEKTTKYPINSEELNIHFENVKSFFENLMTSKASLSKW